MKLSKLQKIILIIAGILILIQFIPVSKKVPVFNKSNDFSVVINADTTVINTLKNSCYDCHSYQTNYPVYSKIAPVSWFIQLHVNEGREHLNFSEWDLLPENKKVHQMEECIEVIENKDMPLKSYTLMHKNARLSTENNKMLIELFTEIKNANTP